MVRVDISHTLVPPQDAVLCGDVMASLMLAPSTFATLSFPGVEKPKKPEGAAWAVDARGRGGVYHGTPSLLMRFCHIHWGLFCHLHSSVLWALESSSAQEEWRVGQPLQDLGDFNNKMGGQNIPAPTQLHGLTVESVPDIPGAFTAGDNFFLLKEECKYYTK